MKTVSAQITALEARKAELEKLLGLQSAVAHLEVRLLQGKDLDSRISRAIVDIVCDHYGLSLPAITGRCRIDRICAPRQAAYWLLYHVGQLRYARIGRLLGRDHGTIMHGCKTIQNRIETDRVFADGFSILQQACIKEVNQLRKSTRSLCKSH